MFGRPAGVTKIAQFEADFPDDSVEDDEGIVVWPGRGIADTIGQKLRSLDFRVTDPRHEPEHGWTFEAFARGWRYWFQVSDLSDYVILVSEDMGGPMGPDAVSHGLVLSRLDADLKKDGRFRNIRWFAQEEYEQQPSERRPASIDYDPAHPLPELPSRKANFGLLRTILFVLLRFMVLPFGLVECLSSIGALQDREAFAAKAWVAAVSILAGTFGASRLMRGVFW